MSRLVLFVLLLSLAAVDLRAQTATRRRAIRAEMAGVLLQSNRFDEAAREYATLVAYEPNNNAYRLGLVRALAWGQHFAEAEAQAAELASRRPGDAVVEKFLLDARSELSVPSARAAQWFAEQEWYSASALYARALARDRRYAESIAQYDTLMLERPSPAVAVDRAYVRVAQRDFAGAERDARESLSLSPNAQAYMLLGDLARWRGDYAQSRTGYLQALTVPHKNVDVAAGLSRLARDERPALGLLPDVDDPDGWLNSNTTVGDNLGVNLTTVALRRGANWQGFDASVGGSVRRFGDTRNGAPPGALPAADAYGAVGGDAAISREAARGWWFGRARARAGFMYHDGSGMQPDASLAATAFYKDWGVGAELSTAPAYPSLLTMAAFLPQGPDGRQIHENTVSFAVAGPLAIVDVAGAHELSALSDGNLRRTVQGMARLPLQSHIALLYQASVITFRQPSVLYWSPEQYAAQGVGVELSARNPVGFSAAARVLPGGAWTRENGATTQAFQVTAGAELTYRARAWELGSAVSYGQGRTGDYRRFAGSLQLRLAP